MIEYNYFSSISMNVSRIYPLKGDESNLILKPPPNLTFASSYLPSLPHIYNRKTTVGEHWVYPEYDKRFNPCNTWIRPPMVFLYPVLTPSTILRQRMKATHRSSSINNHPLQRIKMDIGTSSTNVKMHKWAQIPNPSSYTNRPVLALSARPDCPQ